MSLYRLLFPAESRNFPVNRWTRISLRTLHLIGTAGVGGGFLYQSPKESWLPYLILTVASGFAFMLLELWTNAVWIIQIRGVAILIKLLLLSCLHFCQGYAAWALVISIVISGLISHAPANVRYFSVLHGRRIDDL